ncbi:MAG: efflux RND transporter periplasmic adaptor subunit [Bacteroidia bacterium]|nr:efflux RND transporter periplasmic adaptor subunit [Bacteroidia bacterium]
MDRVLEKPRRPLRRILIYGGLSVAGLLLIGWFWQQRHTSRLRVSRERLSVGEATQGPFQEYIAVQAEILPVTTRLIDAAEGGLVEEIYRRGGEQVRRGEQLLRLSNPDLELNYMNLETNLLEQADQLRNTRISLEQNTLDLEEQLLQVEADLTAQQQTYERSRRLFQDSVIPEAEFQAAQNPYEYSLRRRELIRKRIYKDSMLRLQQLGQVETSLDLVQRNLGAIQRNLDNLVIRAPLDGQLSAVRVEEGQMVRQGDNLAQIDVLNGYKVRARIDQHYLARIRAGQEGEFVFDGQRVPLRIYKVYPEVLNGGVFEADLEFISQPPAAISRGQNVQARIALGTAEEALMIPRGGFFQRTGGSWVYVLDPGGQAARKRSIRLGRQSDRFFEVLEGLQPGEQVILSGYEAFGDADVLEFD